MRKTAKFRTLSLLLALVMAFAAITDCHARSSSKARGTGARKTTARRSASGRKKVSTSRGKKYARARVHRKGASATALNSRKRRFVPEKPSQRIEPVDTVSDSEPRRRNYSLLSQAYQLYDQALSQEIIGNYGASLDKLTEALSLLDQARSHQRQGVPSTMEAMGFFELGRVAEADGDFRLARDSYSHCWKASPQFVEAYVCGSLLQARLGNLELARALALEGKNSVGADERLETLLKSLNARLGPLPASQPAGVDGGAAGGEGEIQPQFEP
ncbi:MAG TPA: hypothetical protein PKW73_05340 [Candidatus Obscuribacter sp.]|nr:hypothetical protein [Candidatus Obscuribacter sp.]